MKKLLRSALTAMAILFCHYSQAQVLVISNTATKAIDISRAELRDIFTGMASSLRDGSHLTPGLLKPGPAHDEFLSLYIDKSDAAFRASWRSLLFSGQAAMPKAFDSETAMVEYVAHTPGAIGYIRKATPHADVKILAIR